METEILFSNFNTVGFSSTPRGIIILHGRPSLHSCLYQNIFKVMAKESLESGAWCEVCEKGFPTQHILKEHMKSNS